MLLQNWSSAGALPFGRLLHKPSSSSLLSERRKHQPSSSSLSTFVCLSVGIDAIAEIAHNKVIVAAAVSAAIGQISKPFTSVLLYGDKFELNFSSAFRAGGFPSAHSSAVVATATSLGLERGFSDAIFGLAVVYAGITMYDAQGVRREVGTHAKELNKILPKTQGNSYPSNEADSLEDPSSFRPKKTNVSLILRPDDRMNQNTSTLISSSLQADIKGGTGDFSHSYAPLKESVGHTEVEVLAGAILGLFVSFIVHIL